MANTNSIVDYLKSTGRDSSYGARSTLARDYGISNYTGSADQNMKLLNSVRSGNVNAQQNIQQPQAQAPIQEQAPVQQQQNVTQPSLTVNSADLIKKPLVQMPQFNAPQLPVYNPPPAPVYTPPQQYEIPEPPKLNTIDFGQAPTIQSQDEILQNIQNRIKPLSDQEIANLKQGVDAGFAPVEAEQRRTNDTRDLFARAAAAQRGDLGFGTSELTYTGLANTQQAGTDALARIQASKVAEQNARIQAANESNRSNQLDLLNQANQYRQQQQQEFQTYVNNQMSANDAALQQYRIRLENTRYSNDQARQNALDQYNAAKDQNDMMRQNFQDQLQSYETQRNVAKDTLSMISELGAKDISSLGDLSSIEASIGLPPGYVNALQQTKLAAENAKNNAQIADVYNQGVQLAMSLPEGQSFSLKNPDGSTTTFSGTKPNEFQVVNNSQGVWRVNKDTGEITQLESFGAPSGGKVSTTKSVSSNGGVLPTVNLGLPIQAPQPTYKPSLVSVGKAGLLAGIQAGLGQQPVAQPQVTKPNVDISKFDPQIQLIINGQTTYDKLSSKDRAKLANQYNQAYNAGLLPSQTGNQIAQQKPLSGEAAKLKGIVETLPNEARQLQEAFQKDYKGSLKGILTGTDRKLVKLLDQVADKVGRLRSGGAVNDTEAARFKTQIASTPDLLFGNSQDAINAINGIITEANITAQSISPGSTATGNNVESLRSKYNY